MYLFPFFPEWSYFSSGKVPSNVTIIPSSLKYRCHFKTSVQYTLKLFDKQLLEMGFNWKRSFQIYSFSERAVYYEAIVVAKVHKIVNFNYETCRTGNARRFLVWKGENIAPIVEEIPNIVGI